MASPPDQIWHLQGGFLFTAPPTQKRERSRERMSQESIYLQIVLVSDIIRKIIRTHIFKKLKTYLP